MEYHFQFVVYYTSSKFNMQIWSSCNSGLKTVKLYEWELKIAIFKTILLLLLSVLVQDTYLTNYSTDKHETDLAL